MTSATYLRRRSELETYFDRTAADAWARLTSDAPVSGVRATVRAGRDAMREILLSWLPNDLTGRRVLDAGCGAGQFSVEAARRGADVVAVDLSQTLVGLAKDRFDPESVSGTINFHVGDMFDPAFGTFDHVVAMDSLIHYGPADIVQTLEGFAGCARGSVVFTHAPRTPALTLMHAAGKLFPKGDRSPAIQPIAERDLRERVAASPDLHTWRAGQSQRVQSGFYISNAMELVPA